jgi:DNA-directed RNA polymerase I subunit RPA1
MARSRVERVDEEDGGRGVEAIDEEIEVKDPHLVSKEISSVSFSFYDAKEAREISVKRVTNPVLFDGLNNPVIDGLYDPAFGPIEQFGVCSTCGLSQHHCPGHFGHIDLVVPVYHPLLFPTVTKVLRCVCLNCHKFKMHTERVKMFKERLDLIDSGQLERAADVGQWKLSKSTMRELSEIEEENRKDREKTRKEEDGEAPEMMDLRETNFMPKLDSLTRKKTKRGDQCVPLEWTTSAATAKRELIDSFFQSVPKLRCENCKAFGPVLSTEGSTKIYRKPLPKKQLITNLANAIDVDFSMKQLAKAASAEGADELVDSSTMAEMTGGTVVEGKTNNRKTKKSSSDRNSDDSSSSSSEDDDDDDDDDDSSSTDSEEDNYDEGRIKERPTKPMYVTPIEAREVLRRLWGNEFEWCSRVWCANGRDQSSDLTTERQNSNPNRFFCQTILVPPPKLRPPSKMGDMVFEHPQNTHLCAIIQANLSLTELFRTPPTVPEPPEVRASRAVRAWLAIQGGVNRLMDATKADQIQDRVGIGIRQQLEKKQGLFRMNMMGKRVNYAARSVISPDPYLGTGEIGVPPVFAKTLTFPELVTPHNVELMRELVERGADEHPGANAVEDERGRIINLARFSKEKRRAIAKTLLSVSAAKDADGRPLARKVYRHLRNGDIMLTNRQPTLHKPGILAHCARVLPGQRTIRMHYANCSTFNADFDGDEINLHFPQDHQARAEAYQIVKAEEQFYAPTDGKPLRGLIQDHICSAVLLTCKDRFYNKEGFSQIVYASLVELCDSENLSIKLPPPTIHKPRRLWTGKDVIRTILDHVAYQRPGVTLKHSCKTPHTFWGSEEEGELIVRQNYICTGVVDKNAFGKFGLIHAVAELHGKQIAGKLLSVLSRLLTLFLQQHGFTCGMDDLVLVAESEELRVKELSKAGAAAKSAAESFVQVKDVPEIALSAAVSARVTERPDCEAALDARSSGALNQVTSSTVKVCLPSGTKKPFHRNCLSLMTMSGAKGSMVNFSQIAAALGQQELEGRRVPRMASGKTLPCFAPFDCDPRAGGYISDRFYSGLRPQEYYFHCMAGREGLVDTAVKTSRSGYLQRCLVKNLEGLKVHYDHTVRDVDGTIVQFLYGDDGIEVSKGVYAKEFAFALENVESLKLQNESALIEFDGSSSKKKNSNAEDAFMDKKTKSWPDVPRNATSILEHEKQYSQFTSLGVLPEKFAKDLDEFLNVTHGNLSDKEFEQTHKITRKQFAKIMNLKFIASMASPGEAVGVIAAQSVGEPSTQMTLNTFHFAGRGEANVTMGIPRLRELLMAASRKPTLPVMTMPLRKDKMAKKYAERLASRLRKVIFAELVQDLSCKTHFYTDAPSDGCKVRVCEVKVTMRCPDEFSKAKGSVTFEEMEACFKNTYLAELYAIIKKECKKRAEQSADVQIVKLRQHSATGLADKTNDVDDDYNGGDRNASDDEGRPKKKGNDNKKNAQERIENENDASDEDNSDDEEGAKADLRKAERDEEAYGDDDKVNAGEFSDEDDAQIAKKTKKSSSAKKKKKASSNDNDDGNSSDSSSSSSDSDNSDQTELTKSATTASKRKKSSTNESASSNEYGGLRQDLSDIQDTVIVDATAKTFTVALEFDLATPLLLMQNLLDSAAAKSNIRYTKGIGGVFVVGDELDGSLAVQCDGVSFDAAFANEDLVDVNRIKANDVWQVRLTLGVEAARRTLVDEISGVFGAYGIGVDARHLSLISDFMCQQGGYRPFSRVGINDSTSPFLKMTYETATAFLTEAAVRGDVDKLTNPSAAIVMGKMINLGTGSIGLQYDAKRATKMEEEMRSMGIEPAKKFEKTPRAPAVKKERQTTPAEKVTFSAFKETPRSSAGKHVTFED